MRTPVLLPVLALAASLALAAPLSPARAGMPLNVGTFEPCGDKAQAVLADLKVDPADIRLVDYVTQYDARPNHRVIGYEAFVSFKSCPGNLVIDMNRDCHVRQVYTRGDCRVDGVPAH
ncbi:MAG: hypothetical protein KDE22_07185 [Rhodobacterales bacterium]|nr:hypothetical protein [Rhodobacterales bacterium]